MAAAVNTLPDQTPKKLYAELNELSKEELVQIIIQMEQTKTKTEKIFTETLNEITQILATQNQELFTLKKDVQAIKNQQYKSNLISGTLGVFLTYIVRFIF